MKTVKYTVTSLALVEMKVQSGQAVSKITVGEDRSVANWPTTTWRFCEQNTDFDNQAYTMLSGTVKEFTGGTALSANKHLYYPGQTFGYCIVDTGTTTFSQVEEP